MSVDGLCPLLLKIMTNPTSSNAVLRGRDARRQCWFTNRKSRLLVTIAAVKAER